jgi:hypothetical protein
METKKQKQQKLKEACELKNIRVEFYKNNTVEFFIKNVPLPEVSGYYAGCKIVRLECFTLYPSQQRLYNQIFNIIQQINEN